VVCVDPKGQHIAARNRAVESHVEWTKRASTGMHSVRIHSHKAGRHPRSRRHSRNARYRSTSRRLLRSHLVPRPSPRDLYATKSLTIYGVLVAAAAVLTIVALLSTSDARLSIGVFAFVAAFGVLALRPTATQTSNASASLPSPVRLSGQAIRTVEFQQHVRGYDTESVDLYLERLAQIVDAGGRPDRSDLAAQAFPTRVRGYDRQQVDAFLEHVFDDTR